MCHHSFKKERYTMQMETEGRLFESYHAKKSVDLLSSLTIFSEAEEEFSPPQNITGDWYLMCI